MYLSFCDEAGSSICLRQFKVKKNHLNPVTIVNYEGSGLEMKTSMPKLKIKPVLIIVGILGASFVQNRHKQGVFSCKISFSITPDYRTFSAVLWVNASFDLPFYFAIRIWEILRCVFILTAICLLIERFNYAIRDFIIMVELKKYLLPIKVHVMGKKYNRRNVNY